MVEKWCKTLDEGDETGTILLIFLKHLTVLIAIYLQPNLIHTDLKKGRQSSFILTSLSVNKEPKLTLPLGPEKCYSHVFHKGQSQDLFYSIFVSVICFWKPQKILILAGTQMIILPTHSPRKQSMYQLIYKALQKNSFPGFLRITWQQILEMSSSHQF